MTTLDVLKALEPLGRESYRRVLIQNHGVKEPCFGVPISELKKFQKRIKKNYQLALELYATGNYDAMYLAGMIADDARMTKRDLQHWADKAYAGCLFGTTVPSVTAGGRHGADMARKWIESPKGPLAAAGWATWSCLVALKDDASLNLTETEQLLRRVQQTIHKAPDVVRYHMNAFVISVGCYVSSLTALAIRIGEQIGPVSADLGNNDCRVPFAPDYIRKVQQRGTLGKKRKTVKC